MSGGHLCEAEAPTEPAGETAARHAAIRFPRVIAKPCKRLRQSVFLLRKYGFFRAYHSCGAQKLSSLGARTTFDRGARRCSLYPALQVLTTSFRMTSRAGRRDRRKARGNPFQLISDLMCFFKIMLMYCDRERSSRSASFRIISNISLSTVMLIFSFNGRISSPEFIICKNYTTIQN